MKSIGELVFRSNSARSGYKVGDAFKCLHCGTVSVMDTQELMGYIPDDIPVWEEYLGEIEKCSGVKTFCPKCGETG